MEFCKETNFKETPIGKIPKDWELKKLGDVAKIRRGASPRPKGDPRYFGGGIPWIKISDLAKYQKGLYLVRTDDTVTEEGKRKSVYLEDGALIISNSGTIGRPAIIKTGIGGCIHDGFITVDPIKGGDKYYLFYFFDYRKDEFQLRAQKGTQGNMNTNIWRSIKLPLPPVQEQLSIVEVLSIVDLAIQKTDEIIAKTERLKKGLMQTLLTRGIGHKEYKQTQIGTIPKTWEIAKLKDVVEINSESKDPTKEIPDKTFIYVDIDSVEKETGKIRNPKIIIGREAPSRARRVIHENDVIMSTVRPYLKAFAIVPKEYNNQICSTGFAVLSCKDIVLPYFLLNVLFSSKIINQCNRMMVGGQYPALNQSQVSEIKIPLPPLDEQQKIAEILSSADEKLELERKEKARLERIRRGLMDLLLTGKIRVKVD